MPWEYTEPAQALVKGMKKYQRHPQPLFPYYILTPLTRLMEDGNDLSDFTLVADGGKEWKVHKVVLFMHSDVLYTMSSSPTFIESKTGRAELNDLNGKPLDAQLVDALVRYLYRQDLPLQWQAKREPGWGSICGGHTILTELAEEVEDLNISNGDDDEDGSQPPIPTRLTTPLDELEWPDLRQAAMAHNFEQALEWKWDDCDAHPNHGIDFFLSIAAMADMYNIQPLKALAISHIENYANCDMPSKLETVIDKLCAAEAVPDEVRHAVVEITAWKIGKLHTAEGGGLLERHPEFALEVFKKVVQRENQKMESEKAAAKSRRDAWVIHLARHDNWAVDADYP